MVRRANFVAWRKLARIMISVSILMRFPRALGAGQEQWGRGGGVGTAELGLDGTERAGWKAHANTRKREG